MGLGNLASPTNMWPNGGGSGGPPGSQQVYFAPRIIVGNVPAGDSAVDYDTDGFTYIADPGDGSGIEAALALLAIDPPGWIHIRRGVYDLSTGTVEDFQVPGGIQITGDGVGTLIQGRTDGSQRVFYFEGDGALRDLGITVPAGDVGATGAEVILVEAGAVDIETVSVIFDGSADTALRVALRSSLSGVVTLRRWTSTTTSTSGDVDSDAFVHLYAVEGVPGETPLGAIRGIDVTTSGGDVPFRVGGVMELTDCVSTGWRGHAIEIGVTGGNVNVGGVGRFVNITSTSSGAAYAGASAIHAEFPLLAAFSIENGSFTSGTATPAGLDVNWGFGADFEYLGPTLIDVTFDGFDGAVYGGATGFVANCYHARVTFSPALTDGPQILNGSSSQFRWYDIGITLDVEDGTGVALLVEGTDCAFHAVRINAVSSDPVGAAQVGIQITGSRVTVDASLVRINGTDATTSAIVLGGADSNVINTHVAVDAEIGGPGILVSGGRNSVRGCTIDASTAGTQTAPIEVTGDLNVISGNRTDVDTTTVPGVDVSGDNNIITGNVLQGSTDAGFTGGVDNTGVDNELDHNIAPA